ncbi:MAG: thermonuclease family protein [Candidatus Yanofskybacteria bacterium]|nr:thermonuclease family protein [Candidatus Yanofskybacteria bacterium]
MPTKRILTAAALLIIALYTQWLTESRDRHNNPELTATPKPAPSGMVLVTKVVDGDTIEIEGGTRVRYIGVNTPETVDPRRPVQCFGKEASSYNASLVEGQFVRLVRDISDTDKYGRLLRYIYLADGTFVNLQLVARGYAYANTYPPDIAHAKEFAAAQAEAREASRGLWGSCPAK